VTVSGVFSSRAYRLERRAPLLLGFALWFAIDCDAATPLRAAEQAESNFAFAHRLGSGVYEISGRTVQIYRLPIEWHWRKPEENRPGVTFTLPLTFGFFGFKFQDVIETGLPEDISTISFVPGVRWEFLHGEHWRLRPFFEAGIARDRAKDLSSTVYSLGGESQWRGAIGDFMGRYYGEMVYSRAHLKDLPNDDYVLVVNGFEATHPLAMRIRDHQVDIAPYGALRWYANAPSVPVLSSGPAASREIARLQGEVGFTVGTVQPWKIGRVTLPRLGLGYRHGENVSVFRLIIGDPF